MIETKEEYQQIINTMPVHCIGKAMHLTETIEALRDRLKFAIRRYDIDGDALDELLDGLPDWITEEPE